MNIDDAWRIHDGARARGPGRVFTPRDVALRLAAAALEPWTGDKAPTLLDPACGGGALLLGAIEWAAGARPGWVDAWRDGAVTGWDLDADSVAHANRTLRAALGTPGKWARVHDGLKARGHFDAVLANPPWISYSGRHARKLDPARKAELAARFPAFAGWPALHTAFAEQCAKLTRQDRGRLGLLLPMQMADLAGYARARSSVTSRFTLERAIDLGEGVFRGVTEPAGMFVFGAGTGTSRPWLPDRDAALISRARRFAPLPPESFGDIGVHTGNAAGLLVSREGEGRPLRVGRDIDAFTLKPPSHVLRDVELPEGKYARVAAEARYRDARIVLRQTAARPIAARHEPWALFRNSVLACFGVPGHDVDYLLAVLNSDALADIHRAMFRDARQRTFPQLKISHLRALPIPGPEIGDLYGRIANASRAVQEGRPGARNELEQMVRRAYR